MSQVSIAQCMSYQWLTDQTRTRQTVFSHLYPSFDEGNRVEHPTNHEATRRRHRVEFPLIEHVPLDRFHSN